MFGQANHRFERAILTGVFALLLFTGCAWAAESPHIVFLSPTTDAEHPFWKLYILFMEAAGEDLGVDLEVVTATDRYAMVDAASRIFAAREKPDYLITVHLRGVGSDILDMAAENGVSVYLVNTVIQPEDRDVIGHPRERYPNWLGNMCSDDRDGGRILATALITAARRGMGGGKGGPIRMIGLSGTLDNAASTERDRGLKEAIGRERDVILERLLSGYWQAGVAFDKTARMLELSSGIRIVWAASDSMALGAARAVDRSGRVAGTDVYVGGFDWSAEGLRAIEEGRLQASAGGHFMEGAWALVLLHDYHKGMDFASEGLEYRLPMQLMDATNVGVGRELLAPERWKDIDFKQFSKVYNGRETYDFSLGAVLDCLRRSR